jgi:hypothetical protein
MSNGTQELRNPTLLPVEEFGQEDRVVFLAMPLVEGCTLSEVIAQRRRRRTDRIGVGHWLAALPEPA